MKVSVPPQNQVPMMVIGVGNEQRGDDAVGLIIARHLRAVIGDAVSVHELTGDGSALLDLWTGATTVIIIDAVQSGAPSGTMHRIDASTQSIPATYRCFSTHAFNVAEAIELGRALRQLPPHVIVYGIEGKVFTLGAKLSPEIEQEVDGVVARVGEDVRQWRDTKAATHA